MQNVAHTEYLPVIPTGTNVATEIVCKLFSNFLVFSQREWNAYGFRKISQLNVYSRYISNVFDFRERFNRRVRY